MNNLHKTFSLLLLSLTSITASSLALAYTPVFNNTHVLNSGTLSVEVMDPVASDRQDKGVRFSPMAWIIQANYSDVDYFYAPSNPTEPPWNSNSERYPAGNPMEFDLGDFNIRPPGFDEAVFGGADDEFIKIGVGILRRTVSGNYHQSNPYQFVAANTQVTWESDRATFTQTLPRETDTGYRYELVTTMRLEGNQMLLDYNLTNNGSNTFSTAQYLHNFTAIGGLGPRSGSEIEVPWSFTPVGNLSRALTHVDGNKLVYISNLDRGRKPTIPIDNIGSASYEFTARQPNLNDQYVATAELPADAPGATSEPLGISSWNHNPGNVNNPSIQFSPEQFVKLTLDPGKSIEWSRSYTFGNTPDFDDDGDVDGTDFLAWQRGDSFTALSSDDLADWAGSFGFNNGSGGSSLATVPEPSTGILLLLGIASACPHRYRVSRQ